MEDCNQDLLYEDEHLPAYLLLLLGGELYSWYPRAGPRRTWFPWRKSHWMGLGTIEHATLGELESLAPLFALSFGSHVYLTPTS